MLLRNFAPKFPLKTEWKFLVVQLDSPQYPLEKQHSGLYRAAPERKKRDTVMYCSLLTPNKHCVEILLFRNVRNGGEVMKAMKENQVNAALVDAKMVPDIFPILVAANAAVRRYDDGDNKTRSVFTEILYNLSPTRNITTSLKTFGISEKTTNIVSVIVDPSAESLDQLRKQIHGNEQDPNPEILATICDASTLQRVYAINAPELNTSKLVDSIVTRMACRDIK